MHATYRTLHGTTKNINVPNCPQGLVVVVAAGGVKKDGIEEKSGMFKIGGGNLYSGHSVTGGKGGNFNSGMLLKPPGIVGAKSFLLAWTLPMLKSDRAMKKAKKNKRVEAIF
ncbi:unnamed protein product [Lupinus luteus]|uniref:Uncharacterized protein n=1 Tax=Lupinus luteus TaxID=3873 RepID=A0AAV1WZ31_LUPLU